MFFSCLCALKVSAQHAYIEQDVLDQMASAAETEVIPVVVLLSDAVDAAALKAEMNAEGVPVTRRGERVITALQSKAEETQPALISMISESGRSHTPPEGYWVANVLRLSADAELIALIASSEAVAYIMADVSYTLLNPPVKAESSAARSVGGIEPGLAAIGAPEMWAMGYTGHGRIGMTYDTGVMPDHPAITERFLANYMPLNQTWSPYYSDFPIDKGSSHGTHVTGTIAGLDPATADTIGVAFGASIIANDAIRDFGQTSQYGFSDILNAYQWAMNPDGDITTGDDMPDVINNSWGGGASGSNPDCSAVIAAVFSAVEAAGIANVHSAGNNGPDPSTVRRPSNTSVNVVNVFAVGAVNANGGGPDYPIANFSSRGPSLCDVTGSLLIKPEVSAPGVGVRSSVGNDGYQSNNGTSMAAPHVSGAVLLLKEAFPYLTGEEILQSLYYSAVDLGEPGEDNDFGMGIINVKNAFDYLSANHEPVPPASKDFDLQLLSIDAPDFSLRCSANDPTSVNPEITVVNKGILPAQGITVRYAVNGGPRTTYSDTSFFLAPGDTAHLVMNPITFSSQGFTELHAVIVPAENEYDKFNNNAVKRWTQLPWPVPGFNSLAEGFSFGFSPLLWTVDNPDLDITWEIAEVIQPDGDFGAVAVMRFSEYAPAGGQADRLIGPWLPALHENYTLRFDHFYRRRTNNPNNFDSLAVSIAYNCGDREHEIFRKGGENLYTNEVHQANSVPESMADWQTNTIHFSLSDFPDLDPAQGIYVIFKGINRRGNNLMIDNIMLDGALSTADEKPARMMTIFPNPARDEVRLDFEDHAAPVFISVYDISGRRVIQDRPTALPHVMQISGLNPGIYLVEAGYNGGGRSVAKLVVR